MAKIFLGVTGASGAVYAGHTLRALTSAGYEVGLCVSDAACQVIGHEIMGLNELPGRARRDEMIGHFLTKYAPHSTVEVFDPGDFSCRFASGSSGAEATLIAPCSMSTLANIAHGTGSNLIHRAAEVMLKERRCHVLDLDKAERGLTGHQHQATALSLIQIENMATVTRAGAVVLPAMPGLYTRPETIDDMIDFVVGRALDHLGVENTLAPRWGDSREALA